MTTEGHTRTARGGGAPDTGHACVRGGHASGREVAYGVRRLREGENRRALSRDHAVLRYMRTEPTTLATAASPGRHESRC
ncbi:hypothetical protein GCM10012286_07780 [Streptomyces lasiicapitis]|uniref:Uncharacterized protein n=1 Tax=Streptomyces lasiicapitis TaxID=1923961 RepID=A0ABQ2LJ32_9ACTN|nr:hypothetical protein GCM10012286_07780 [Streptomyces lasiicapitis]